MDQELLTELYKDLLQDDQILIRTVHHLGFEYPHLLTSTGDLVRCLLLREARPDDTLQITFWRSAKVIPGWIVEANPVSIVIARRPDGWIALPYRPLRRAWAIWGREWCKSYGVKTSKRDGFEMRVCNVPIETVRAGVYEAMCWTLTKETIEEMKEMAT